MDVCEQIQEVENRDTMIDDVDFHCKSKASNRFAA